MAHAPVATAGGRGGWMSGAVASAADGRRLAVGIDVGGTFTDAICVDAGGRYWAAKVPSTPGRAHAGVVEATRVVLEKADASPRDVVAFIHGTTVATNAIIERKGVRVGVLMTEGFEDTLEIGRYKRSKTYDLWFDIETPVFLAPRRRRRGIRERIGPSGEVLEPLDEDGVRAAVTDLVERHGVEAVAICFLMSFHNDAHERRAAEIAGELYPDLRMSLSSSVNPEVREYERLCVTAFDAYIAPVVGRYISELRSELAELGVEVPLQVMESRGGIADSGVTIERPSTTIMSGPAAGVIGALQAAALSGFTDVISIDIGGTSSDVSLVVGGKPLISREGTILTYPIRTPMIDVNSIGAGGGSVAWFDSVGGLHVGPQSAGSDPGPTCYGRGGTDATVTDASVVLGFVNPDYFAGGSLELDPELAHRAVSAVAERLGVSALEAAWGIHRIVNANMTDQIRVISVGRGHDPRRFALVLLGGAGALHGCPIAADLGISTLIVPTVPGVLSAFGLLVSDIDYEQTRTLDVRLAELANGSDAIARLEALYAQMDQEGIAAMRAQQIDPDAVMLTRALDMRYVGQSYELEVVVGHRSDAVDPAGLEAAFEATHARVYGYVRGGEPTEILNLRTVHALPAPTRRLLSSEEAGTSVDAALKGTRNVYFGSETVETPIFERATLPVGTVLEGPAVVEQIDTTVVLHPGWTLVVDPVGQLVITRDR